MKRANQWTRMGTALAIAAVMAVAMARGETEVVDGLEWAYVVWDGEAWLGRGPTDKYGVIALQSGSEVGDITIPSSLGWYPVVGIGAGSFQSCKKITDVHIPDTVTNIGNSAFSYCSGLRSVEFGRGVESIGDQAFYWCRKLESVRIDGNGETRIGSEAFHHCDAVKSVEIGNGVKSIGNAAFQGCKAMETVEIGNGVATIESNAFSYYSDSLKSVTIAGNGEASIGEYAFWHCGALETVEIGKGVEFIEANAFTHCPNLKSVVIEGNGNANVGEWAFYHSASNNPATLEIGDGVRTISEWAFARSPGWETVIIGNGTTDIGQNAFLYCSGLKSVEFGNSLRTIGNNSFKKCSELESVVIPDSVTNIGESAFSYCSGLRSAEFGRGLQCIGFLAFYQCQSLESLQIEGNGETRIDNQAFRDCDALKEVKIGKGVKSLGDGAFYDCDNLETIHVPASWKGTTILKNAKVRSECTVIYDSEAELELGSDSETIPGAAARGKELEVTATVAWKAKSSASWLTIRNGSGKGNGTVVYDVAANTGGERAGTITVSGGGLVQTFTVIQARMEQRVTFDPNGGTCGTPSGTYGVGGAYGSLPKATKSGAVFAGWYTAKKDGTKVTASSKVPAKASRTLYAHWTTTQTLTYDANGGKCPTKNKKVTMGKKYGALATATKAGFGFVGWGDAPESGVTVTADDLVTAEASRTAYAQWTTEQTVTFDGNGGSSEVPKLTCTIGGPYGTLPGATSSTGVLEGWYTAKKGGTKVTATSKVTDAASRTLYAHWTTTQTLTYNANGGKCPTKSKKVTIGKKYGALATATKAGYGFTGWRDAQEGGVPVTADDLVTAEASRTAYAQWTTKQAVTFDANGGSSAVPAKTCTIGGTYGDLPGASSSTGVLEGWYTAKKGGTKITAASKVTEQATRTLYAHWTTTQTLTYNANGGKCSTKSKKGTIGKKYGALATATKAGVGFAGWGDAPEGGVPVTADDVVTAEAARTVYAQWTTEQTVTFDANGGNTKMPAGKYAIGGTYGSLPMATKAGAALVGWFTAKKDGTKVTAASKVTEKATRTLYAHWTTTQTLTYNANGGKCSTKNKKCTIGKKYGTLATATRAGFGFVGWRDAPDGGVSVTAADVGTEASARTLYAEWTTNQVVTFDPNGGSIKTPEETYTIGATYGNLPTATKAGSALAGWFTAKKDGTKVTLTSKVTEKASRTLYAHWTTTQTVTFNANGGKCSTKSKKYTVGKTYASLPTATWSGHVFWGWVTEDGKAVAVGSAVPELAARTLYAQWDGAPKPKEPAEIRGLAFGGSGGEHSQSEVGTCVLSLEEEEGVTYEVQWTADLLGEWMTMQRWTAAGDGAREVEIQMPPEPATGFLRVTVSGE